MSEEKTITIPLKEYNELLEDSILLGKLQKAGVENWEWYDDAISDDDDG
jgi:hypothetical protein